MPAPPRIGGSAVGGSTRARESRPGGAIVVPAYDAAYYLSSTGRSTAIGGSAIGGRRQLVRPAAGIVALPDAPAGTVTLQWWWAYAQTCTIVRIDADGTRTPVRGGEGIAPVGASRTNPQTNPRARDSLTGYSAGANTTLSRQTGLTPGPVAGVSAAVRGTAAAAGAVVVSVPGDAVSTAPATYGFEAQTSAVATALGLSVEWFDGNSTTLGSILYSVSSADRTRAAAGLAWLTVAVDTAPAAAAVGVLSYRAAGLPAGGWLQLSGRMLVPGTDTPPAPTDYFDGDSLGAAYIGTDGVSFSQIAQLQTLVDAEAPLDAPVSYEVTASSVPGWLVRSEAVRIPGAAVFGSAGRWGSRRRALLTHPGQARTVRLWIQDAPELEDDIAEGRHRVKGRRNLVVVQAAQRDGWTSSLDIWCETGDELDRLLDMLAVPSPMLLRLSGDLVGYPPNWWQTWGKVRLAPLERSGRIPLRKLTVPVTTVDRPTVAGAIAV